MLSEDWVLFCQSDKSVIQYTDSVLKLLSFENYRFIVVLKLSDFYVIVLEVFKLYLRVFNNYSLKELSVKAFSVAESFRELKLSWNCRRRLRRYDNKINII